MKRINPAKWLCPHPKKQLSHTLMNVNPAFLMPFKIMHLGIAPWSWHRKHSGSKCTLWLGNSRKRLLTGIPLNVHQQVHGYEPQFVSVPFKVINDPITQRQNLPSIESSISSWFRADKGTCHTSRVPIFQRSIYVITSVSRRAQSVWNQTWSRYSTTQPAVTSIMYAMVTRHYRIIPPLYRSTGT